VSTGAPGRPRQEGRRGVTVELAGIPGAGKSRLARTLATELAAAGIGVTQPQQRLGPSVPTARRLSRKLRACAAAAAADPGTTTRIVRAVLDSGQPGPRDVAGRVVQWLVAQHVTARARPRDGVSIVDEGLLQCLWSIGLRGDVEPVLAAVAASRPSGAPDLVVVVRVPPEVALERLTVRASRHSRTQLLPERERLAELRRGDQLLGRLADWWAGEAALTAPVLTVVGTDAGADDRARVLEQVRASLEGNTGPLR
jgi:hypothetical protein